MQNQLLDIETVKGSVQSLGLNRTFPSLSKFEEKPMIVKRNTMTVYELFNRYKNNQIRFEEDSSFAFKSSFIESILLGISNPEIVMYQQLKGGYCIVSGGLYLNMIIHFMLDEYALSELNILSKYNKLKYSNLPSDKQAYLQKFVLHYQTIETRASSRLLERFIFDKNPNKKSDLHKLRMLIFDGRATQYLQELSRKKYGDSNVKNQKEILSYIAQIIYNYDRSQLRFSKNRDLIYDGILYDMNQSWDLDFFRKVLMIPFL